jgi:hypothetical protein
MLVVNLIIKFLFMEYSDKADLSPQKQSGLLHSDFNLGVEHPCGV